MLCCCCLFPTKPLITNEKRIFVYCTRDCADCYNCTVKRAVLRTCSYLANAPTTSSTTYGAGFPTRRDTVQPRQLRCRKASVRTPHAAARQGSPRICDRRGFARSRLAPAVLALRPGSQPVSCSARPSLADSAAARPLVCTPQQTKHLVIKAELSLTGFAFRGSRTRTAELEAPRFGSSRIRSGLQWRGCSSRPASSFAVLGNHKQLGSSFQVTVTAWCMCAHLDRVDFRLDLLDLVLQRIVLFGRKKDARDIGTLLGVRSANARTHLRCKLFELLSPCAAIHSCARLFRLSYLPHPPLRNTHGPSVFLPGSQQSTNAELTITGSPGTTLASGSSRAMTSS